MKHFKVITLSFLLLTSTFNVYAAQPKDSVYLDGGSNKIGLILAHGRGKNPTWKVVEPLRLSVHSQLGYHTLSLQMPNDDKYWESYADDFPTAYRQFNEAVEFLKTKGATKIYLMGHSMGSRMAAAYISKNPNAEINGLILAGCRNNGDPPLSCSESLANVKIATLDIWGGDNNKDVNAARERENLKSALYTQVEIDDTNHRFDDENEAFVVAVVKWLQAQK